MAAASVGRKVRSELQWARRRRARAHTVGCTGVSYRIAGVRWHLTSGALGKWARWPQTGFIRTGHARKGLACTLTLHAKCVIVVVAFATAETRWSSDAAEPWLTGALGATGGIRSICHELVICYLARIGSAHVPLL